MSATPHPSNFPKANYSSRYTFPDSSNGMVVRSGQKITISGEGGRYPGFNSFPAVTNSVDFFFEVTFNVTSGTLTRSNIVLPPLFSWHGSSGLTARGYTTIGAVGWPPSYPAAPTPIGPDGRRLSDGAGTPPRFTDSDNPNMSVYGSGEFKFNYTSDTNAQFTVSSRFVLPSWNGQTVNYYYTNPYTTPQYTLTKSVAQAPSCPPSPRVSFQYRTTFPDARRPFTIRRSAYRQVSVPGKPNQTYRTVMPTNRMKLEIMSPQNIPTGSTFQFEINNVSGNVDHQDVKNITWHNKSKKIWRRTTSSNTGVVISQDIVGHGGQGTEKFKIKITYQPPTVVIDGCTYTYTPIVVSTQTITIKK